jgi:hypothetical protein
MLVFMVSGMIYILLDMLVVLLRGMHRASRSAPGQMAGGSTVFDLFENFILVSLLE